MSLFSLGNERSEVSLTSESSNIVSLVNERSRVRFMNKSSGANAVRKRGGLSLMIKKDSVMLSTILWNFMDRVSVGVNLEQ